MYVQRWRSSRKIVGPEKLASHGTSQQTPTARVKGKPQSLKPLQWRSSGSICEATIIGHSFKVSFNLVGFICFQFGLVWPKASPRIQRYQPHHLYSGMEWVPNASFGGILHHPSSYDCSSHRRLSKGSSHAKSVLLTAVYCNPIMNSRWTGNNSNEHLDIANFFANQRTFRTLIRAWTPLLKWFSDHLLGFPLPLAQFPRIKPGPLKWPLVRQRLLCKDAKTLRIFGVQAWPRWIQIMGKDFWQWLSRIIILQKLEQLTFYGVDGCSGSHSSYLYNRKPDEPPLPLGRRF